MYITANLIQLVMKNRLVFVIIVLISIGINNEAYSQGTWGAEAGLNFANIEGDDISEETDIRTALLLAVYYQYPLANSPIILQPELMYSQKGLEFGEDGVLKLDYIVAAALAAYYFDVTGRAAPFVKAGPYAGFNVTAKQEFNGNEGDVDDVKDIDAGVIIRAGVQVDRFEIGVRFSRGLTDVFDGEDGKHTIFGLFVGVGL